MLKIKPSPRTRVKLSAQEERELSAFLEETPFGGYKYIKDVCGVGGETIKRVLKRGWGELQTVEAIRKFLKYIKDDTI